jgi:hypothetical protein
MKFLLVPACAVGLLLANDVWAAPLELQQIAAEAKWLAHLDLDAVRSSSVVQKAWQKGMEKHKDAENKLAFVRAILGMDPTHRQRFVPRSNGFLACHERRLHRNPLPARQGHALP